MGQNPSVYVIVGRATPTGDPQTRVPPGIVVVVTHIKPPHNAGEKQQRQVKDFTVGADATITWQ